MTADIPDADNHPAQDADPLAEAGRILDAAESQRVVLRAAGGVGIATICPSSRTPPLQRQYNDIDFVCRGGDQHPLEQLLERLGYVPDVEFNALHGQDRLFFHDGSNGREVDIFVAKIQGAHELDLRNRLQAVPRTLAPADLLLSKLQVYETNEKDLLDIVALLTDQPISEDDQGINLRRIVEVCCGDWGWWRTVTMVADRTLSFVDSRELDSPDHRVEEKLRVIKSALETEPKSRKWKMRARIGERLRWYQVPEEIEH